MERVHSDGAIPPGRKYFLLMRGDTLQSKFTMVDIGDMLAQQRKLV